MNKRRAIFSTLKVILSVLMIFAYLPVSFSPVHASGPVTAMDFTMTGYEYGKNVADVKIATSTEGISISKVSWSYKPASDPSNSYTELKDLTFTTKLVYKLTLSIDKKEGYTVSSGLTNQNITVNGEHPAEAYPISGSGNTVELVILYLPELKPVLKDISSLNIAMTGYERGKNISDAKVTTDTQGAVLDKFEIVHSDYSTGSLITAEGTFMPSIQYVVICYFSAASGYTYTNVLKKDNVKFNGTQIDYFNNPAPDSNADSVRVVKYLDQFAGTTKQMYRLYNPNSGEHFYTASTSERADVINAGWNDEGVGWTAPEISNIPVYRLYNANGGEHHYTMNVAEKDMLVNVGWQYEGIGWYSAESKTVPLYRQYNPNAFSCNHNYTTSKTENDWLASLGWKEEGISWYGV